MSKTTTKRSTKTTTKAQAKTERVNAGGGIMVDVVTKAKRPAQLFQGKIAASKLFVRDLEGFSTKQGNGCTAKMWLAFNEQAGTVTVCNTYREDNMPKSSWDPSVYTYEYKPAVHDKKMDSMTEVDPTELPAWVELVSPRKRSKAKAK